MNKTVILIGIIFTVIGALLILVFIQILLPLWSPDWVVDLWYISVLVLGLSLIVFGLILFMWKEGEELFSDWKLLSRILIFLLTRLVGFLLMLIGIGIFCGLIAMIKELTVILVITTIAMFLGCAIVFFFGVALFLKGIDGFNDMINWLKKIGKSERRY